MLFRYGISFFETDWSRPQMAFFTQTWGKNGKTQSGCLRYQLQKSGGRMSLTISSGFALRRVPLRLSPFATRPALPTSRSIERHREALESHKAEIPACITRAQRESFTRR